MKKILFSSLLLFGMALNSWATVFPQSGVLTTAAPKDCEDIKFYLSWSVGCNNYPFSSFTHTVSGSTLTININHTSSPICLGAIAFYNDTATISGVAPGTYTVVIQGVLSGSNVGTPVTLSSPLIVGTCCPIVPQFTGSFSSYCAGDTVNLTSTSASTLTNRWFVNGSLHTTGTNMQYVIPGHNNDSIMLVSDTTTCSDTTGMTLNVMTDLSLPNDTVLCLNDVYNISATAGWPNYLWSTGSTSPAIQSIATNVYTVTTTAASGCMQVDSIDVEHRGPAFSLGADTSFCAGSSLDLTIASHWSTVQWVPSGDTNRTRTIDSAGVYVAEVTNGLGCKFIDAIAIAEEDTILSVMGSDSVCVGSAPVSLYVGSGNSNILWSNGSTDDTIHVTTPGTYTVTATGTKGCDLSGNGSAYFHALPIVDLGNDTTICLGDTLVLDAGDASRDYFWFNWSTDPTFPVWIKGEYSVRVTDANGCIARDTINVMTIDCDTVTDPGDTTDTTETFINIHRLNNEVVFNVYPVPASQTLYIESKGESGLAMVKIVDIQGRIIMERVIGQERNASIDVSGYASGTYLLHLRSENGVEQRRKIQIR